MESKQSFAKIGVFVLLGLNVGAYYYFWPRQENGPKAVAKAVVEEKGEAQLLPPKAAPVPGPAEPAPLRVEIMTDAVPLAIPIPPAFPEQKIEAVEFRADAAVKLVEHIAKEVVPVQGGNLRFVGDLPILPAPDSARTAERVTGPGEPIPTGPVAISISAPVPDAGMAIASPLTPKMPPGLWQYQTEKIGNRTHLTARLRDAAGERVVVEFRIHCDRVETHPQNGAIRALGNVAFSGAGWKGACQSVTLPIHEPRLVFEQQVQVTQDILGSSQDGGLRGERIVWELPSPPPANLSGVTLPLSR